MSAIQRSTVRPRLVALVAVAVFGLAGCTSSTDPSSSRDSSRASASEAANSTGESADSTGTESLPPEQTEPGASAPTELPSSIPAPATTEVPAPGGGDINQTVEVGEIPSNPPVPLSEASTNDTGVSVALAGIEQVTTEANLPGEIAGPGLKVTVKITNGSSEPLDLSNVVVDLQDAVQTPSIPMTTGATPLTGFLAAGEEANGVYIFTTSSGYTDPATVTVTYSAGQPVAVFVGNAK